MGTKPGPYTYRKRQRTSRNSKEEQRRLQILVEEWDNTTDSGITFEAFCKKNGIPSSTLHPYCHPNKSKRRKATIGHARHHLNALIAPAQLEKFVSDRLHLKKPELIQELKRKFQLNRRQADNQYYNNVRPILLARLETPPLNSTNNDLDSKRNTGSKFSSWFGFGGGLYLVYHLRKLDGRFNNGWDPTSMALKGQKAGHPLRNHQPVMVKNNNRGVTDGAFFIETSIQIELCIDPLDNDLVIIHQGLHQVPHGTGLLCDKNSSDERLRNSGVNVIDVPNCKRTFSVQREDDGVAVYRSGTPEARCVSMSSRAKKEFLHYLIDSTCEEYRSVDVGRDVGNEVYRYDLLFNQAQRKCYLYADAEGFVVEDSNGDPLRVPNLRSQTQMLRLMPEHIKAEFTQVLTGMNAVSLQLYPDAFHDERRHQLVQDHFVRDFLGDNVCFHWEYLGLIARKITGDDRLAFHLDAKNDWRRGYDICSTYSFITDGYRVTIVAACKQDFGSLMDRLSNVEVEGGQFLPPE